MSLLADSAAITVLVLAWDETAPVVRALLEAPEAAEPTADSVVVLVPTNPISDELTPEEFLPLSVSLLATPEPAAASAAGVAPAGTVPVASASLTADLAAELPGASATTLAAPAQPLPEAKIPVALWPGPPAVGPAGLRALAAAALGGPAARVLPLGEGSLLAHTPPVRLWLGPANSPAAPYLGSSIVVGTEPGLLPAGVPSTPAALSSVPAIASAATKPLAEPDAMELSDPAAAPSYLPADLPPALDAEPDTLPVPITEELFPAAAISTTELDEAAKSELVDSFTVDVTPVQTEELAAPVALSHIDKPGMTSAQAAASEPLAESTLPVPPPAGEAATPVYAALLPITSRFDAANLNFQIIQYARLAVPLALAAQPFVVIYAPAWPTWLAAQELRQRTGLPLVLHLATLAAADEPLDLAAGWPAEIQRQALHRADLILTETPALAHRLRRELNLPAHRVRPVPAANAGAVAQALSTVQAQVR